MTTLSAKALTEIDMLLTSVQARCKTKSLWSSDEVKDILLDVRNIISHDRLVDNDPSTS